MATTVTIYRLCVDGDMENETLLSTRLGCGQQLFVTV